ncbi:hypothetical protein M3Y97_01033400 [Aphelenchoides bicaudatus]|nr:hypothetical protein M3Y97_01033400 [Aphelenchoides bicaudatus]
MEQILRNDWFTTERYGEKAEEALKKASNFYLERQTNTSKDYRFYVTQYSHFLSDLIISATLMREVVAKTQSGWSVYTLLNRHRDDLNRNNPNVVSPETVHSSDNIFMFGFEFLGDLNFTRSDFEFRDLFVQAVVDFVKNGDPNGSSQQKFVKATKQNLFAYTELDSTPKIKNGIFEDVHNFWEAMVRDYKYDIIFGVPLKR